VAVIFIWSAEDGPEDYTFSDDAGWKHLLMGRMLQRNEIEDQVQRYRSQYPEAVLVSVVSSYGGGISILCNNVHIVQNSLGT
jgi:hypothetical protein